MVSFGFSKQLAIRLVCLPETLGAAGKIATRAVPVQRVFHSMLDFQSVAPRWEPSMVAGHLSLDTVFMSDRHAPLAP